MLFGLLNSRTQHQHLLKLSDCIQCTEVCLDNVPMDYVCNSTYAKKIKLTNCGGAGAICQKNTPQQ